jgi:RND family efflux transporter MFP subunit
LKPQPGTSFSTISRQTIWQIISVIIILVIIGGYTYYSKVFVTAKSTNGSNIQTAIARRGNLVLSASGTGILIANSEASFGFETSGQVTQVYVKVGDQVEAGQVLAQLDDTLAQVNYVGAQQNLHELYSAASIATIKQEIATAQDTEAAAKEWLAYLLSPEVVEAEDNLAIAEKKLVEARAAAKANPSDVANQALKEGERSVAFLNEKLNQAWTYYQDAYLIEKFGEYETVGKGRNAKQVLVMTTDPMTGEEVPETNGPSAADLATAHNNLAQAQETILEGQAYRDILNSDIIPDNALGDRVTTLYQAQLALENAQSALDATGLIAPISGTVTSLDINVGEQAGTSSVITISQLSQPYTLDVYLDEADWSTAQVGNKVNVTFDLLPEQTYPGTVTLVYPELSPSFESSLVHLIVQLNQSISQDLPAGTGASVEVVGGEAQGVVLVPVDAIHRSDDGTYIVYILQNGGKVEQKVEIGLQNDSYAGIKSGLEAGDVVAME